MVIAGAILIATGVTWHAANQSLQRDKQAAINDRVSTTERTIEDTLNSYEEILQGGVGLLQGSDEVTAGDWANFLTAYSIKTNYPSAQTIGFMKVVPASQVDAFTAYMRSQPGFADYTVHPLSSSAAEYAPLMYAQAVAITSPINFGLDGYSSETRRQAMFTARDTGHTTLTGSLTLQPLGDTKTYSGFSLFVPYYITGPQQTVTARRQNVGGYVYASFRADKFFGHTTATLSRQAAAYQVRTEDTIQAKPLYSTDNYNALDAKRGNITVSHALHLYGRDWHIDYIFQPSELLSSVQLHRPTSVLIGGIFSAVLIGLIVLLLLKARAHELTVQKERAVELAKDELLSLASHQLRTPATGVKQYLGMILQGFAGHVSREQMTLLGKAYASNDRQLQIINEILHLAKIESGRIVLARTETDLNALVQDILTELQPDITAAKHHFETIIPKRPMILTIDAHTLRMAIENVISNAIKYTHRGGSVTIKLYKTPTHAFIRVRDTGVGIQPQDLDKLFKQFSRLPNEMSLAVGGTGIGLYLAKHLVELHGGTITVKSAPGKGSTFTIVLPLDAPL